MTAPAAPRLLLMLFLLLAASSAIPRAAAQVAPGERDSWPTSGWRTAAPEAQGMDPILLDQASARVQAEVPLLSALVVIRGGDIVFEEYYNGQVADEPIHLWSAIKSVTNMAVGLAVAEGLLRLDQSVGELIPERIPAGADPRTTKVTVEQLLTMTGGWAWDSTTDFLHLDDAPDWAARTLGLPMACDPGTCYEYNSGGVHLLSVIVQKVTGQTEAAYLQGRLFDPLGIAPPIWRQSPQGETAGAFGLELNARAAAKLGYLYLNQGAWDGQQIVPAALAAPAVAQATPPPVASPTAAQEALPAATPITGGGRVFALPAGGGFPEGIAYDAETGDFYVGSSIDGTIYRGNVETGTVEVFLPGSPGRVALGLALDENGRLFVAGGDTGAVAVYDTATGQQLLEVANGLAPNTFLNDVAVSPTGDAYITDSFNPTLFRLAATAIPAGPGTPAPAPTTDPLEIFVDFTTTGFDLVQPGFNANGIVATPDGRYLLLVQTNTGSLYRVDTATGETIQVDLGEGSLPGGDGLEVDGQTLYAVREGQITVVTLAVDFASGSVGASFSDPSFASPTTIARVDGCLLVVNSQFDALQGQPELPFTVSSVPIAGAGGATPVAAGRC